ncbi:MAG: FHA domain-containing protein [Pseudomonadota bacterium]
MYLQDFQLKAPPFADIPDPVWYVPYNAAERAFASLCVALQQSDPVIILNGPHGIGKTQLLRRLSFELDRSNVLNFIGYAGYSADELLLAVADGFDIAREREGTAALVSAIGHFLHDCVAQDQRAVLVLDDAHLAPPELLEHVVLLSNHVSSGVRPLTAVVSGSFDAARPLPTSLRARARFQAELGGITEDECEMYIQTRWHIAGASEPLDVDKEAVSAAMAFSGGVPRALGWALDSALSVSAAQREGRVSAKTMQRALAVLRGEPPVDGALPADAAQFPTPPDKPVASTVTPITGGRGRLVIANRAGERAEIDLALGDYSIGRSPECDIQLESSHISRQHARLEVRRDSIALVDLGGVNKPQVNGDVIDRHVLSVGDRIQLGEFALHLEDA